MTRRIATALVIAALTGSAGLARAQQRSGFAVDRFDPSERGSDWFTTESLDLRGDGRLALGLVGDFAYRPLAFYDPNGNVVASLVRNQLFLHAGASFVVGDRLRIGMSVPLAVFQDGHTGATGGAVFAPPSSASFGDLRLGADVRIVGRYRDPFSLAAGVVGYLPTGSRDQYTGDGNFRVQPRVLVAGDVGDFAYAARVGFEYRPLDDAFGPSHLGSEIPFAASFGVRLSDKQLLVGPELFGSTVVTSSEGAFQQTNTPLEALLGAHLVVSNDYRLNAGGGAGLTRGYGSPQARAVLSIEWAPHLAEKRPKPPTRADRDGDGIYDDEDACPDRPGVRTNDPETNGCPPPADRDHDGILDKDDACPDDPGIVTQDPTTNGCPDRDGDGIPDKVDMCPDVPGVKTDDPKTNGCPGDRDKDGVPDKEDACPDIPGIKTNDPQTNGCPDPDRDKDGIPNVTDACPDEPGPPDPDPKKNGCPKAFVQGGEIKILDQVKFRTASALILPGKDSEEILQAVLKVLKEHPEITKVRVEGHTDNVGGAQMNKTLSANRAASVVKWLVAHGVDAARLTSAGFGMERPIDDNKTEAGRRNNRRVEFHIEK